MSNCKVLHYALTFHDKLIVQDLEFTIIFFISLISVNYNTTAPGVGLQLPQYRPP